MTGTIASTHVDTGVHPVDQQFNQWRAAVVGFEMTRPEAEEGAPFRARVDAWPVGDIVVLRGHLEASHSYRVVDTLAQPQNYSFMLVIDGDVNLHVKGRRLTVGHGQMVAIDWRQPVSADVPPGRTMQVVMPQLVLQAELGDLPDLHGVIIGSTPGRILTEFILSLVRELPGAAVADTPILSAATVKMIAACVSGLPVEVVEAEPFLGQAIRERVRRHIEARIGVAGLSVASISRDLGISRATLYRAFAASGGVSGYLQLRRLEGAHASLVDRDDGRPIKAIASAYGFASAAHFNNAFRRRFGYPPGDARSHSWHQIFRSAAVDEATPEARLHSIVAKLSHRNG